MEDSIKLNNGVEIPRIGFGTYQMPARITQKCVCEALATGYRHIDTAQCYGNEREVGTAVRESSLKREEVFVTTKLWGVRGYDDTRRSIDTSLQRLGTGTIDLLLIHEPSGNYNEIWRAMEDSLAGGQLRAIGVANFIGSVWDDLTSHARIIPAVNQIETHVYRQQKDMHAKLLRQGVLHESWSPLACGQNGFFRDPVLKQIADAHGKSIAQVGLRYLYQQDIAVIPKTTHIERMRENLAITDFSLTEKEMQAIASLDTGRSQFGWW